MFITKYFQVFHVTVPSSWVALLLSFVIAYGVIRVNFGKKLAHLLGDSIFYFIIVWKLSVIFTDFKVVMQFPLSILYFNGGKIGVYLGVLAVMIHLFFVWKKTQFVKVDRFGILVGSIVILSMYQAWMAIFNAGPLSIRIVTILVFFVFILMLLLFMKQFKTMPQELLFLTSSLHLFISALQPAGVFQPSTIISVIMTIIIVVIMKRNNDYREAKH